MKQLLLVCALISVTQKVAAQDLFIKNVRIIGVEASTISAPSDVLIRDGNIYSITTHNPENIPNNIPVLDGDQKFLAPGFINAHTHIALGPIEVKVVDGAPELSVRIEEKLPQITLALSLAHGITTARDAGGLTDITTTVRNNVSTGKLVGPELLVAGTLIDNSQFKNLVHTVKNAQDIKDEIQRQKAAGVNFIKLYTGLSPKLTEVGISYAHELGLTTIAHLQTTSWTEAARSGIDNIVHIIPGNPDLLPEEHREEYLQSMAGGSVWFYKWFEYVDFEGPEIQNMLKTLQENNVAIDPTMVLFHSMFFAKKTTYKNNENLKFLPESMVADWKRGIDFTLGWTDEDFDRAGAVWPKVEEFLRLLHNQGLLLTAGTDDNNPWITPGDSFHKELILYQKAGLSNADILKMATINGAKLLGIEKRVGTITVGKEADLVLLAKNPFKDISNTQSIVNVINNGTINTPKELLDAAK